MKKLLTINALDSDRDVHFMNDGCYIKAMWTEELISNLCKPHLEDIVRREVELERAKEFFNEIDAIEFNDAVKRLKTYARYGDNRSRISEIDDFDLVWRFSYVFAD